MNSVLRRDAAIAGPVAESQRTILSAWRFLHVLDGMKWTTGFANRLTGQRLAAFVRTRGTALAPRLHLAWQTGLLLEGPAMHRYRWPIVAVFVLSWLANATPAPAVATEDVSGGWRRTREGWQRVELVCPAIQYSRPALHPGVVGLLEVLLTMTAMLALSDQWGMKHVKPLTISKMPTRAGG